MPTAAYFRAQALYCREQAGRVNDPVSVDHLLFVAQEYEAEAERMAEEEASPTADVAEEKSKRDSTPAY